MVNKAETDKFLTNESKTSSSKCYSRWWNQDFQHQRTICRIIESTYFRALVIFLVIADTCFVIAEIMLDSYKIHYECESHTPQSSKKQDEIFKERIELGMEIAHFSSIGILGFFVIELIIRVYASGKEFWNIHRKKMEYFDAFVVITSLIIDLYYLGMEKKILGEKLLLLFSFRLWRFVRIVSSVAEGIRHGQIKHKRHLNKQYLLAIHRLIDLMKYKTNYFQNNSENLESVREYYQMIDNQCQASLDELNKNHELTSSIIVAQFIEQLNGLENKKSREYHLSIVYPTTQTINFYTICFIQKQN